MASHQTRPSVSPLRILRGSINKTVMVKIKEGSEFVGKLILTDPTMNVVLEEATEYRDGGKDIIAKYGRIFIRGSQILYISIDFTEAIIRQAVT